MLRMRLLLLRLLLLWSRRRWSRPLLLAAPSYRKGQQPRTSGRR
jgi:hypothetical protein